MTTATRIDWSKMQGSRLSRNLGQDVDSYFTALGRDGAEEIQETSRLLSGIPGLRATIAAMPLPVSVLNEKAQVVLTNLQWNESLGQEPEFALGKRHGELFGCSHSDEGPDGCSTGLSCASCGAAGSIAESQQFQEQVTREYRLDRETPEGREVAEWRITTTPIQLDDRSLSIFVVQDMQTAIP